MKERHDNDKIEPHNHNEYPLLYKEAKILKSFGQIFRVPKVEYISYNMGTRDFPDIYMPAPSGLWLLSLGIYIRQIPRAHIITYIYISSYSWYYQLLIYPPPCTL